MTNFSLIQNSFAALVAAAEKFSGFVIPDGVTKNISLAASELEAGKVEEAEHALRAAQAELARELRAYINNSPSLFAAKLAGMKDLDLGLKAKLEKALRLYSTEVKKCGWQHAAGLYNAMGMLVAQAPAKSRAIKAAKAAEMGRRIDEAFAAQEAAEAARQEEERRAAADAAQKAQAEKKAAAEKAARHETAEKLRRMVVRKVA